MCEGFVTHPSQSSPRIGRSRPLGGYDSAVDAVEITGPDGAAGHADGAHRQSGLDDLYDIGRLADRLGVEHATIRVWLSRKVPWLPAPDGRLNGGAVWRASTLVGIETRRAPGRPGRKPRAATGGMTEPAGVPATRPTEIVRKLP